MVHTPNPLWERIERFQTDKPGHQFPFSHKLAQEQGWSHQFTQRAIVEYKRFVYLCCVLPRGASPPPIVDAVWHLHLTYTRSYWQDFCPNCLGQDLHHNPSAGGSEEGERHRNWYNETLAAYEQIFDQPPPPDIWPPLQYAAAPIDPDRLPPPKHSMLLLLLGTLVILPAYLLAGAGFLRCFGLFLIWCGIVRWIHYQECGSILGRELFENRRFTLPELAFITGNRQRIRQLVIADGIARKILVKQEDSWNIDQALLQTERPFYAGWFSGKNRISEAEFLELIDSQSEQVSAPFRPLELWLKKNSFPQAVIIIPLILAMARIIQAQANNRPVGYLILELVVSGFIIRALPAAPRFHASMAKALKQHTELVGALMQTGIAGLVVLEGLHPLVMKPEFQDLGPALLKDWTEPRFLMHETGAFDTGSSGSGSSCSSSGCGSSCGGGCGGCGGGD